MSYSRQRRMVATALLVFAIVSSPAVNAQNRNNRQNVVRPTLKGAASELPTVKRVTADMITVGDKTYEVSSSARIFVNGEKAELDDIEIGMQAKVSGGVAKFGKTKADTIYKATRISAKEDNQLEAKRKEFNKKQRARAQRMNQRNNRNRNRNRR